MTSPVLLDHRSIIAVSGADAETFLQGLVTVSTLDMTADEMRYGALLTPQGKVIADMLLSRDGGGFCIDCDAGIAPALLKRLRKAVVGYFVGRVERYRFLQRRDGLIDLLR